jgi:hypothetical protein
MNIGTRYKLKQMFDRMASAGQKKNTWLEIYLALDENGIVKQHLQVWMNVYSTCLVSISRPGRLKNILWMDE